MPVTHGLTAQPSPTVSRHARDSPPEGLSPLLTGVPASGTASCIRPRKRWLSDSRSVIPRIIRYIGVHSINFLDEFMSSTNWGTVGKLAPRPVFVAIAFSGYFPESLSPQSGHTDAVAGISVPQNMQNLIFPVPRDCCSSAHSGQVSPV